VTYFLGRLDAQEHHLERAQRYYRKVLKSWPLSVYALWSSLSCGDDCGSFPVSFHHPSSKEPHLTLSHRQRLLGLIQLGLWGPAWTDYIAFRDRLMTEERFLRYGDLALHLDPVRKLVLVDAVLGRTRPSVMLSETESLSPSVIAAFGRSGVSVPWAISIARQESRFDPTVLSIDGAMGVMQLMPMTALSTLRQASPDLFENTRLNLGSLRGDYINALVGGLYLKRLFDHFPDNPERAVASYNAGMHSIVRWSGIAPMDWDFFIEGIPYTETRRYAREVLWNHEVIQKSSQHLFVSGR
jgi:soluble lytic murein transglycosylase